MFEVFYGFMQFVGELWINIVLSIGTVSTIKNLQKLNLVLAFLKVSRIQKLLVNVPPIELC